MTDGLVASSSKFDGVAVKGFALVGLNATLGGTALDLLVPLPCLSPGLRARRGVAPCANWRLDRSANNECPQRGR